MERGQGGVRKAFDVDVVRDVAKLRAGQQRITCIHTSTLINTVLNQCLNKKHRHRHRHGHGHGNIHTRTRLINTGGRESCADMLIYEQIYADKGAALALLQHLLLFAASTANVRERPYPRVMT